MTERKKELASIGRGFSFEEITNRVICPYYRKTSFGLLRCEGSNLFGKCGYPSMNCPIPRRVSDIIEVD